MSANDQALPFGLGTAIMVMLTLFALLVTYALTGNLLAALLAWWAVAMGECVAFIDARREQQKASEQGESRG